jgi:hypothetical protein
MSQLDKLFDQLGSPFAAAPPCANAFCPHPRRRWRLAFSKTESPISLNGQIYCGFDCFEQGAVTAIAKLLPAAARRSLPGHRIPLGLLMLSRGLVNHATLKEALRAQREAGAGKVGEWLCRLGAVNEDQVTATLGVQWGCPVFPLERHPGFVECARLVPLPIVESVRMVVVHYLPVSRHLYVAFAEGVDHTALYALEQIFRCRTEPSLTSDSAFRRALDALRRVPPAPEQRVPGLQDPLEMARLLRRHAAEMEAQDVRMASCAKFIWARLESATQIQNLLFEVPFGSPSLSPGLPQNADETGHADRSSAADRRAPITLGPPPDAGHSSWRG